MSMDLPAGPLIVRVVVLTVGLSGIAEAAPGLDPSHLPEEGWEHGAQPPWLRDGLRREGSQLLVVGIARGDRPEAAERGARAAATASLLELLRRGSPGVQVLLSTIDPATLATSAPGWLPLQIVARERLLGGAQPVVALRCAIELERFEALVSQLAQDVQLPGLSVGYAAPVGLVVLRSSAPGVAIGDRLLAVDGVSVRSLEQIDARVAGRAAVTLRLQRGEAVHERHLSLDETLRYERASDELAPTCGPCCHGDCGGWGGPLDLRK